MYVFHHHQIGPVYLVLPILLDVGLFSVYITTFLWQNNIWRWLYKKCNHFQSSWHILCLVWVDCALPSSVSLLSHVCHLGPFQCSDESDIVENLTSLTFSPLCIASEHLKLGPVFHSSDWKEKKIFLILHETESRVVCMSRRKVLWNYSFVYLKMLKSFFRASVYSGTFVCFHN